MLPSAAFPVLNVGVDVTADVPLAKQFELLHAAHEEPLVRVRVFKVALPPVMME
jgi:hypothetical protein